MDNKLNQRAAIEFRNVSKYRPDGNVHNGPVLQHVSGQIAHGQIVTLVGPSGSGKSTLLSMCNLLLTPDEGEVFVEGKEVRRWDIPALRRHVGLVFQNPTMFPGSVLDNISLGSRLRGEQLDKPAEWLHSVGLTADLLSHSAENLSGGQKQRVALARVLANEPSILLLDEVTSALDPASAHDVETLLLHIHQTRNTTMLWVTHNLEQAKRLGHVTWLFVDGRLVEAADTNTFFTAPKQELTQRFLLGELGGDTSA